MGLFAAGLGQPFDLHLADWLGCVGCGKCPGLKMLRDYEMCAKSCLSGWSKKGLEVARGMSELSTLSGLGDRCAFAGLLERRCVLRWVKCKGCLKRVRSPLGLCGREKDGWWDCGLVG
jgi:hypothetical protein